jgi:cobyrinic acid a,c-diamide synthase
MGHKIKPYMTIPAIIIAGTHSGVGKTSISIGIMRALRRRGLTVQSFKIGPDFIDPGHHRTATGRISHNLDGWMLSRETNNNIFQKNCNDADIAVIEGVMGLFDGYGSSTAGSTAQMAKWLGIPVILVIDAKAIAASAAALIHGYTTFDRDLNVAAIICNRIGSVSHLNLIREAVKEISAIPILGGIPRDSKVEIKSRHLGLWMSQEDSLGEQYIDRLADLIEADINLDELIELAQQSSQKRSIIAFQPSQKKPSTVKIGIAKDNAFCFYYQENLDLLREFGAELIEFSPIQDSLPENLDGIYFGGGYPELHAEKLANNQKFIQALQKFCQQGNPVYGECGGLIYLSQGIEIESDLHYPFVGIFPFWTRLASRAKLGYTEVKIENQSNLFPQYAIARGHRFHYSEIIDEPGVKLKTSYTVCSRRDGCSAEGFMVGNTLASYVHLHFASNPDFPQYFVCQCRKQKRQ